MTKTIKLALCFLSIFMASALTAQESVYIWKDNNIVGNHDISALDSISFRLPDNYPDPTKGMFITPYDISKNEYYYRVTTPGQSDAYMHGAMLKSHYEYFLKSLLQKNPGEETPEEKKQLYTTFAPILGEAGQGTQTYLHHDNNKNPEGDKIYEVIAGQSYNLFAYNTASDKENDLFDVTFTCDAPGISQETLGLNDLVVNAESVTASIDAGSNVIYAYTAYGYKNVLDAKIEELGLSNFIFLYGQRVFKDEFGLTTEWPLMDDNVYSLYIIGIDRKGDQVVFHQDLDRTMITEDNKYLLVDTYNVTNTNCTVNVRIGATSQVSRSVISHYDSFRDVTNRVQEGIPLSEIVFLSDHQADITTSAKTEGTGTATFTNKANTWNALLFYVSYTDGKEIIRYYEFWPEDEEELWEENPYFSAPAGYQPHHKPTAEETVTIFKNETLKSKMTNADLLDQLSEKIKNSTK